MARKKIHLEYMLNTTSGTILWNTISTTQGLQSWFADQVTAENRIFTFQWDKDEIRQAELINIRTNSFVRFHWLDDEDPKSYFELKISYNDLTGDYTFEVTDFADEDETEELIELWNLEVETLQRQYGI